MPKGYIYAELEVTDPALFETYRPLAAASIAEFGGRYAVRGGDPKVLEGDGPRRHARCSSNSIAPNAQWNGTTRRNIKPPYRSGCDLPRPKC
jgi:hypothetical protein